MIDRLRLHLREFPKYSDLSVRLVPDRPPPSLDLRQVCARMPQGASKRPRGPAGASRP
ncbi:hypothetical protein EKH55_1831 [Sinorhizobium alkalisoli]|nr:hypothetical protein EKH55_1831 [Sinorhizobium alkalisoli]